MGYEDTAGVPKRGLPIRSWPDGALPLAVVDTEAEETHVRVRQIGLIDPSWFGLFGNI